MNNYGHRLDISASSVALGAQESHTPRRVRLNKVKVRKTLLIKSMPCKIKVAETFSKIQKMNYRYDCTYRIA